jgi:hypothetical protein
MSVTAPDFHPGSHLATSTEIPSGASSRDGSAVHGAFKARKGGESYRPGLPAPEVHALLQDALASLRRAERHAVLWFAEIRRRRLHRDLGYASLHQYAREALGFSASKTSQFVRLAEALDKLPALREFVESGQIGWTKAREVVKVATPRSEERWLTEAKRTSRRELERKIAKLRARNRAARVADPQQGRLIMDGAGQSGKTDGQSGKTDGLSGGARQVQVAVAIPQEVTLRFAPEDYARFEALLEKLWKLSARRRGAAVIQREEFVLAGLDALLFEEMQAQGCAQERGQDRAQESEHALDSQHEKKKRGGATLPDKQKLAQDFTRVKSVSPYHIVIYKCEVFGGGQVVTSRGQRELSHAALAAASCDAQFLQRPRGEQDEQSRGSEAGQQAAGWRCPAPPRSRSTIPPAVRQAVLARDGYRCRAPGCGRARFLEVHHLKPKAQGGKNDPGNLVTLCSACHRLLHERRSEIVVSPIPMLEDGTRPSRRRTEFSK